jgi:hypothetical protein
MSRAGMSLLGKVNALPSLEAESLMRRALDAERQRGEPMGSFEDLRFLPALNKLIASAEQEAQLHPLGRYILATRIIGNLRNRHRLEKAEAIKPVITQSPVIISGLQRSGSTFLHRLLAAHPQLRALMSWEAINPRPSWWHKRDDPNRRIREARQNERGLKLLAPRFFAIHPVEHLKPEEDILLLDLCFSSQVAEATMHVPTFSKWVAQQDQKENYAYLKRVLTRLENQEAERWVLKTPQHLEYLEEIHEVFPAFQFIMLHRDPLETLPSFFSMVWHGRQLFSDHSSPEICAEHWLEKNILMLSKAIETRKQQQFPVLDISYKDFIANPLLSLEQICDFANLQWNPEVQLAFENELQENRKDRFGKHRYQLDDFSLKSAQIKKELEFYYDRFAKFMS